ncbi:MAG: efflux RND transporter periplasmic adaptor subunit [Anaerolineales bacterium]|nr:efflux RND transporter periplasmic adaptor subunit [Anaerolineales bacterium]
MRKLITILLILGLLAGGAYAVYVYRIQPRQSSESNYQTVAIQRGQLTPTISATGMVRSNQAAALYWGISGVVEQVHVAAGEQVAAGEVLATLERYSLPRAILLAQAELIDAWQALEELYSLNETKRVAALQSIASYTRAVKDAQYRLDNYTGPREQTSLAAIEALDLMETRLEAARKAFKPYKYLSSSDPTRHERLVELNQAQNDYNAAVRRLEYEYRLEAARAGLERASKDYQKYAGGPSAADIAAIQARIDAAQASLDLQRITAPFAGALTIVEVKPGDQVSPGKLAFQIDDLSRLLVDVAISEVDINHVDVGQQVSLSFDAIQDQAYHGLVSQVAQTGASTQDQVEFTVTIELGDADARLKPGMTAAVSIIVGQLEDVLLVPNRAVRLLDGKRVVYVLKGGQLTAVEVTLGASSETYSQALAGDLQAGDLVVLNPPPEAASGHPAFIER